MIKRGESTRDFISRNHTVLTALRHKQRFATIVKSNLTDVELLMQANALVYLINNRARVNYKNGRCGIPALSKNLIRLKNEKKEKFIK